MSTTLGNRKLLASWRYLILSMIPWWLLLLHQKSDRCHFGVLIIPRNRYCQLRNSLANRYRKVSSIRRTKIYQSLHSYLSSKLIFSITYIHFACNIHESVFHQTMGELKAYHASGCLDATIPRKYSMRGGHFNLISVLGGIRIVWNWINETFRINLMLQNGRFVPCFVYSGCVVVTKFSTGRILCQK